MDKEMKWGFALLLFICVIFTLNGIKEAITGDFVIGVGTGGAHFCGFFITLSIMLKIPNKKSGNPTNSTQYPKKDWGRWIPPKR